MANRVHNKLEVIGTKEHMKAFLDKAIKVNGDTVTWQLSNTLLENETHQNGKEIDRDLDWCREHLGTKWDVSTFDDIVEIAVLTDSYFKVYFDSAWSPPHIWLKKMINQYPNINFKLFCTEELLSFTAVLFNNEDGCMTVKYGEYIFSTEDGRPVNLSKEGWVYIDNGEPGELITTGLEISCNSSVQNYIVWFEKD